MSYSWILLSIISMFLSCGLFGANISYPKFEGEKLYPKSKPYNEGYLQVSSLHKLYFSEFGNPAGIPVVTVHGGPGAGCDPNWAELFDPEVYHVVMFDQRGAKRSIPFAEMEQNTPSFSIQDMEQLRTHLGINQWIVFGGSWGSALSLLYSEAHPDNVLGLVLRGVFLAREKDYMHLFYGMYSTYPEAWDEMVATVGADASGKDLVAHLHAQVMSSDPAVALKAARAFMRFDMWCAFLYPTRELIDKVTQKDQDVLGIGRAFIHYSKNRFFIEENQILDHISQIAHIPTIIVQGRYDVICPVAEAYELHKVMPQSELWIVPDAGHSSSEPSIICSLKAAMDRMKNS